MRSLSRLLIRVSAFLRKEIFEILRQPRLILTLVLGPFLILLLFGIGYRNDARVLRAMFVVEPNSPIERELENFQDLGPQLDFVGVQSDPAVAEDLLRERAIDLVIVTPPNAYETIRSNQQATFTLYHNEIDPFQIDYIRVFGRVYIDEVNRRLLRTIAERGQSEALTSRESLAAARDHATELRAALVRGDATAAREHQAGLDRELDALEASVGSSLNVLEGVQETLGSAQDANTAAMRLSLSLARQESLDMGEIEAGRDDYTAQIQRAASIEANLTALDGPLGEFQQMDPTVLVSPFRSETQGIATIQPELAHYFAPAVIVLLLQHLAVTFAALSIVREARLGTMELFRVSPISPMETLVGKYLSYMLFGGVISLILTLLLVAHYETVIPALQTVVQEGRVVVGLGVPMLGLWSSYAAVVGALLFASLGLGFVISLIVDTDSQAVQYSMIVLLTSVFFSGFFLSIQSLWEPVRLVSWSLPATYTILLLQDIMLRGRLGEPSYLAILIGIGVFLYLVAWFLLRRKMGRA